ncbi:hypothetical protein ABZ370_24780 [Streptomyces sp. NPDC005962]|uniref:hypothetical protein n=1 Tax=Streptomyces sp. NPDC005962 TaxID=3154466 RepID=UPI00340E2C8B
MGRDGYGIAVGHRNGTGQTTRSGGRRTGHHTIRRGARRRANGSAGDRGRGVGREGRVVL